MSGFDRKVYSRNGELIKDPVAYMSRVRHYEGGLTGEDGMEIRNPWRYFGIDPPNGYGKGKKGAGKGGWSAGKGSRRDAWDDSNTIRLYKADGTEILNAEAYVANIHSYSGGLYTTNGEELKNPASYVAKALRKDVGEFYSSAPSWGSGGGKDGRSKGRGKGRRNEGAVLYTADGQAIRNPEAFVAKIAVYEGGLYTSDGQAVRNPHAFIANIKKGDGKGGGSHGGGKGGDRPPVLIYKKDGTQLRNPERYIEGLTNYTGGLYTQDWVEIRNPQAYLDNAMATLEKSAGL